MDRAPEPLTANDYLGMLRGRWYVVAVPVLLAVAAVLLIAAQTEDSYRANAVVSVRTGLLSSPVALVSDGNLATAEGVAAQIEVVRSEAVSERAESIAGSEGSFPSPDIAQVGRSDLVTIGVTDADPARAAAIANAYAVTYLDVSRESLDALTNALESRAAGLAEDSVPTETDDPLADLDVLRRGAIAEHLGDLDVVAADADVSPGPEQLAEVPSDPVARDTSSKVVAAAIVGLLAGLTLLFGIEMMGRGRGVREEPEAVDSHG